MTLPQTLNIFFVIYFFIVQTHAEHYWKDFRGTIPSDAVLAGVGKNDQKIYVAQVLRLQPYGSIVPGYIDSSDMKMHYAYEGHAFSETNNIKILCTDHPGSIAWVLTNITALQQGQHENLVLGGADTYPMYIGRQKDDGETVVGKVTLEETWKAFGYALNGTTKYVQTAFEALIYLTVDSPHQIIITKPQCDKNCTESCTPYKIINININ